MTSTHTLTSKPHSSICHLLAGVLIIGALIATIMFSPAAAKAALVHPYTGQSFGPSGIGPEVFSRAVGIAVNQNSGDVFVYDAGSGGEVYKFDESGEPVNFSASGTNVITGVGSASGSEAEVAVDSSSGPDAGDIYVANNSVVRIYGSSGSFLGELTGGETCGVAVAPTGVVYVGVYPETVRKYTPVTNPVSNVNETASMGGVGGVCNVAADSEGNLYAARYSGEIKRYEALQFGSPAATGTLIDETGRTLAVDPVTNHLYANGVSRISEYDSTGGPLGSSGDGTIGGSFGVAVKSGVTGDLYVPNEGSRIDIFGPSVILPDVTTGAASSVTDNTATLSGAVNPDGIATTYQFEYGTSTSYGSLSPAIPQNVGSDSTNHNLSTSISGLASSTVYHYRIVATNENGTNRGADETLRTTGPPTIDGQLVDEITQTGATIEPTINPGGFDTHYEVEYGTSSAYGSVTTPVDVGSGNSDQSVSVHLSGLQVRTAYHFRVIATNSQGPAVVGPDETFETLPSARIDEESFSGVGSAGATLNAQVNDFGLLSTYHYEYGTSSAYGSRTPETDLGAVNGDTGASALIDALQPDTVYHFRIVVTNQDGVAQGADTVFSTLSVSSSDLPDKRVYEMVTPSNNQDANVYVPGSGDGELASHQTSLPFQVALDGSAVAYAADPTSGGNGDRGLGNEYVATRSSSGWTQANAQPPGARGPFYQAFSNDLSVGFVDSRSGLSAAAPDHYHVLYGRMTDSGTYVPFVTGLPPNRLPNQFGTADIFGNTGSLVYAGVSSDDDHVLFAANDALTPFAETHPPGTGENDLYDASGGSLSVVNVLPGSPGAVAPNATFGSIWPVLGSDFDHVISSDGSRIFWTDLNTGNLYVREDSGTSSAQTVQVDASVGGGGAFRTAGSTGSRVFFTKGGDLYVFDTDTNQTVDLAPEGQVLGVTDTSEDGSYIYYVAEAILASGASVGQPNLYLSRHVGAGWTPPVFIATLSPEDYRLAPGTGENRGVWLPVLSGRTAETTPDGRSLVFASFQRLTGYDNAGRQEVYVYSSNTDELLCVSCNRSGEPPAAAGELLPVTENEHYMMRWISADGSRIFFNDRAGLVAQDRNGRQDVYEWERDGAGVCRVSRGCLYLLSGGSSTTASDFANASLNGDDVFIVTRAQLLAADQNENVDLYDVRAGGTRPPSSPACTGSGCQGVPPAPPIFATPSSVTFNGVGNFTRPAKSAVKSKSKTPTRAQRLSRALKACASKQRSKRATCRALARKRYGAKAQTKKSTKGRK